MTTEHTLIAALSTLLIAGLLIYLRREFRKLEVKSRFEQWQCARKKVDDGWLSIDAAFDMLAKKIAEECALPPELLKPLTNASSGAEVQLMMDSQPKRRKYRDKL